MFNKRDYSEYMGSVFCKRLFNDSYIYKDTIHKETIRNLAPKYKHIEMVTNTHHDTMLPVLTMGKPTKEEAFFIYGLLCIHRFLIKENYGTILRIQWEEAEEDPLELQTEDLAIEDVLFYLICRYTDLTRPKYCFTITDILGEGYIVSEDRITKLCDWMQMDSITSDCTKSVIQDTTLRVFPDLN